MPNKSGLGMVNTLINLTRHKMFNFMVSILLLLILSSILEGSKYGYLVLNSLSTAVFLLGVHAVGTTKRNLIILVLLGLPWFLAEWIYIDSPRTIFTSVLFFLFVTGIIFNHILHTKDVTADTLFGAVCVYLLLGLLWASIYGLLEHLDPGTIYFSNNAEPLKEATSNELIYYSYLTLASLGYGDITFLTPEGRIISVLEAVTGQLFIAFLVARLVSIYTTKSIMESRKL